MSINKTTNEGCTVEGNKSNQSFYDVYIDLEDKPPVVINMVLRGYEVNQTTSLNKVYCTRCGKPSKDKSARFCSKCGSRLE